jgi:hypothetical protein
MDFRDHLYRPVNEEVEPEYLEEGFFSALKGAAGKVGNAFMKTAHASPFSHFGHNNNAPAAPAKVQKPSGFQLRQAEKERRKALIASHPQVQKSANTGFMNFAKRHDPSAHTTAEQQKVAGLKYKSADWYAHHNNIKQNSIMGHDKQVRLSQLRKKFGRTNFVKTTNFT